ncbi:hypothetical protein L2E82_29309 [Cichorium intybus]|uniref:Uncharacterized protein n=1 Tax=Cichorium intybus TaxID=13427 RepID=A0ACB9CXC5_CICIN|nr:hypothetical protein L2E82_29309 [Cichorium intybus]
MSLPTPLINHPPLRKGDSNHFISLTSTTYSSLILVDNTSTTTTTDNSKTIEDYPSSSPDSVINTKKIQTFISPNFSTIIIATPSGSRHQAALKSDLIWMKKEADPELEHQEIENFDFLLISIPVRLKPSYTNSVQVFILLICCVCSSDSG